MSKLHKVTAALAAISFATIAGAGEKTPDTNLLFLSSDIFMAAPQRVEAIPQFSVDDRSDRDRVQYSLKSSGDIDPQDFKLSRDNCIAVLGLMGAFGLGWFLRDRLFQLYR